MRPVCACTSASVSSGARRRASDATTAGPPGAAPAANVASDDASSAVCSADDASAAPHDVLRAVALAAALVSSLAGRLPGNSTLFTRHFGAPSQRDAAAADAAALLAAGAGGPTAARLRVNYLSSPLSIDTPAPKFSWALSSPARGAVQSAYQIVVSAAGGAVVWDSGKVASAQTLNVKYAGATALSSDADYTWTVTWWDAQGVPSAPATASFSTALYDDAAWRGAAYVSSGTAGELNTYRTTFTVGGTGGVTRARLYVLALGYVKTEINGALTDDHELGTFTTFEQRVLYDTVDVTALVRLGCNGLGVQVGHGWWAQPSVKSGPRGFRALLSVTTADGGKSYFASSVAGGGALVFTATAGPVTADDIYEGETFDGGVAAALAGFSTCGYTPGPGTTWSPAAAPAVTPATLGSVVSAHNVWIRTDREYTAGAITQPGPGQYVFDFVQNMAAQVTLRVPDCPAGTVITMRHSEILYSNGSVHNHYAPSAKMTGVYICAGTGGEEVYNTQFTYYGSRYIQLEGFPGVPGENALTSRFIHSDFLQAGEFSSSDARLNAIQHATRYASWSNWMDIPTDCPQRERRGWLGDAQLSFETVISNIDGGAAYSKWIGDLVDTQVYDNRSDTFNTHMAMPDCVPFYGHGHPESDPGWGIAAWNVADWFGSYYADEDFERTYYTNTLVPYMEHWISLAQAKNPPLFPVAWWGDWAEFYPGPYGHRTADYADFFYVTALQKTLSFATRLNIAGDVARYTTLLADAQALYLKTYYNATNSSFVDGMYASQFFGLTLGLLPAGSAEERAAYDLALTWIRANGTNAKYPGHFGGGIIALKNALPLMDRFGDKALALTMQTTTGVPSFGQWLDYGATTLWESYENTPTGGQSSYNHIMFGAAGSWYYSTLGGLGRAPGSRSWSDLVIAPPRPDEGVPLQFASASIDTPMGLAAASWAAPAPVYAGDVCGAVAENEDLTLTCAGGTFSNVVFASFGAPMGTCTAGFAANATCNAPSSVAVVRAACVGKASCTISATNANFGGDPCFDVVKSLAVALSGSCTVPLYTATAVVPANGRASVVVPAVKALGSVVIREGAAVVWSGGAFVPGTPGVTAGAPAAGGKAVAFTVGGGSYSFVVDTK